MADEKPKGAKPTETPAPAATAAPVPPAGPVAAPPPPGARPNDSLPPEGGGGGMPQGVPAPREAGPGEVLVLGQAPGVTVQAHGVGGQPNPGEPGVVQGGNVNVNRVNTGPIQRVHPRTQMDSSAGPARVSASHGGGTTNYPGTVPRGSVAGVRDYCRQQAANAGDPAQQGIWAWTDQTLSQLLGES